MNKLIEQNLIEPSESDGATFNINNTHHKNKRDVKHEEKSNASNNLNNMSSSLIHSPESQIAGLSGFG